MHGGKSLREKVGLDARKDDALLPIASGFERAKKALEEKGARKKKDPACTFQPEIDQRSRIITDLSRSGELTERLHADFEKTQHRLSKLRQQHERAKKKDPECTFAPTLKLRNGFKGKGERSADEVHRAEPRITRMKMEASAERLYSTHEQSQAKKTAQVRKRDEMIQRTGAEFAEASKFLVESNWDVEKATEKYFKTRPRWGAGGTRISQEQKKTSAKRLSEYKTRKFGDPKPEKAIGAAASGFGCSVPSSRLPSARSSRSARVSRLSEEVEDRLYNVPTEARRASSTPRLSQSQRVTQMPPPAAAHSPVPGSHAGQSGAQRNHRAERKGQNAAEQSLLEFQDLEWAAAEQSLKRLAATDGLSTQSSESNPEDEVRKVLKHFYDTNHPEFASAEKINEIIRFYKEKGESNGIPEQWQELLWEAYVGKGVDPRQGYRDSAVA